MAAQDILLADDFDLSITPDGDFTVGDSDVQHIILLIETNTGAWKQYPTIGVGIEKYSGSSGKGTQLRTEITATLKADGFINVLTELEQLTDGTFNYFVDAKRNG
jgi:hypothetical protein